MNPTTTTTAPLTHFNGEPVNYDREAPIGRMIERDRHGRERLTASALREEVTRAGSYFFAPKTMHIWRSRLLGYTAIVAVPVRVYDEAASEDAEPTTALAAGVGFITSDAPGGLDRRYTVRAAVDAPDAPSRVRVETIGDAEGYPTSAEARIALLSFADSVNDPMRIMRELANARQKSRR